MDDKLVQELLDEFFPTLEALETQSSAILQFLKAKGMADDDQLAPYFEQAAKTSNVKWLAARLRINHLISSAAKAAERAEEQLSTKAVEKAPHDDVSVNKAADDEQHDSKVMADGKAREGADSSKKAATADDKAQNLRDEKEQPDEKSEKNAA